MHWLQSIAAKADLDARTLVLTADSERQLMTHDSSLSAMSMSGAISPFTRSGEVSPYMQSQATPRSRRESFAFASQMY